ncbi:MAG: hypothetical protein LBR06_02105 [Bacteroidales bacterium]|jgi:hypothetical protein|nr:hypothetical protein [Bacteroidales bacterium]
MDTTYLRKLFFNTLSEKLICNGLKYVQSHNEFVKKTVFGKQALFITFTKWRCDDGIYIDPGIIIRFDEIENFYHETSYFEKKYQKGTFTIGMSLDNAFNESNYVYQRYVENESAANAANYFYELFQEIVLPLFNKYNTLESMNELLNSEPDKELTLVNSIHRGIHGIIAAYLLKIPDEELNKLIDIYTKQYTVNSNGFYKPEFDKVVENIRKHRAKQK